jgi:glutathione S-transferase
LFDRFGLPVRVRRAQLYSDALPTLLAEFAPARTVPALKTPEGHVLWDTLAIAETLAERHPEAGLWPAEARARACARSITAEMHSGFAALRGNCPMNLRVAWEGFAPSDAVRADLGRIEALWAAAMDMAATSGPWLFGEYSVADAFFAPVAARIAGFGLPMGEAARAYVDTHLNEPSFRRWRAMGQVDGPDQPVYAQDLGQGAWPGPAPRAAQRAEGPSENAACPYSGDPVTDFLETDGRVFGFCNPFCRDKTLADPDAWPAFTRLRTGT